MKAISVCLAKLFITALIITEDGNISCVTTKAKTVVLYFISFKGIEVLKEGLTNVFIFEVTEIIKTAILSGNFLAVGLVVNVVVLIRIIEGTSLFVI